MSRDIYFTPVYDRYTQKSGILIDSTFIDQIRLKLYEEQKTGLSAMDILDYLQRLVDQEKNNREKR